MLAGSEFQSLGRAIVKEDEYEDVRWDGIVSIVSWRERVFRLWWEERDDGEGYMYQFEFRNPGSEMTESKVISKNSCVEMELQFGTTCPPCLNFWNSRGKMATLSPSNFLLSVRRYLNRRYDQRWMGRGGPVPRSLDLNPLDFYVWGFARSLVYTTGITIPEELQLWIVDVFQQLKNDPGLFERILGVCRED
ncbi:hypothetical protein ANN_00260 [Periplaneta americana]|uniref:Uncharacterized protein n=1 Tax=Periplaneta americana TaxID=6978 RepID=A0ABQ8TQC4_PERAM|nr:hypothetical protein ANN_00260 [Periplaneta americana]